MPLFSSPSEISAPSLAPGGIENVFDYGGGFLKSAVESFPELIGIPPSDETLDWRAQNPVGGFLSGMISPIPEFGLAAKGGTMLMKMIPKLRALEEASPVIGGIVKGTLGMGGIDAARIAGSMLAGGDTSNVIQSSIVDTAMQAGLGGVGGLLAKYGPSYKAAPTFGTENLDGPLQVRARELQAKIEGGGVPQEQLQAMKDQLATWSKAIRGETVKRQARQPQSFMTRPMVDTLGEMATPVKSDNKQLNRLFAINKPGDSTTAEGRATLKRRLVAMPGHFSDEDALAKTTGDAQLPLGYEFNGQHFRHISFTNQQAAANINKVVKNNMLDVGDGWYLAREQDPGLIDGTLTDAGGLYVMAKKVGGPNKFVAGKPVGNQADQWIVFKTDKPGFFKPEGQKFSEQVSRNAWDPMEDPARQKAIQDFQYTNLLDKVNEGTPLRIYTSGPTGFLGMGPKASLAKGGEALARVFTKVQGWGDGGYALDTAKAFLTEYLSPTMFQFAGNPLAKKIYTGLRTAFDIGSADTLRAMHGEVGPLEGSIWKHAISGGERQGGLDPMIKDLSDTELEEFNKVFSEQKYRVMTPEQLMENLNVSPKVAALNGAIQEHDLRNWIGVNKGLKLSGEDEPLKHLAGHMGISRTWEGDFRVEVYSETGDMVAMGAGKDRAAAIRNAKNLVDEAAAQGKTWTADPKVKLHDVWDDIAATKQLKARSAEEWRIIDTAESKGRPGFFKRRKGLGGYEGERGFTRQEFIDKLTQHDAAMSRLQSEAAFNTIYGKQMEALAEQAPGLHRQMNERLHQLMGHQGAFGKLTNEFFDRLLAPAIGKNSASKIVNAMGRGIYGLKLGMGNISLPVTNLLNFTQNLMPEMAFLAGGAPNQIAKYYSHQLIVDEAGKLKGKFSTLNGAKIMGEAAKLLGENSDPEFRSLFQKMLSDGTVDPRVAKEFIGSKATIRDNWKTILKGGDNRGAAVANLIEQVGNLPAEATERLSRAHAIGTGFLYGRDFLELKGGDLERFVREFTDNTMYRFGTADRSKIFAGPFGQGLGLFKNWMMHYMWNIMRYTGEASRGNLKPLMLAAALPTLAGGVPATGGLYYLADKISRIWNNKSLMERIYESFGADNPDDASPADLIYQGLPGYLPKLFDMPGVSLTNSLSLPMGDPGSELLWMATPAMWDQGKLAGKALADIGLSYDATGGMTPDAWSQLGRAFLPKIFYRGMNAANAGMINSATTLEPMITDLTPMERFYYMMGVNPSKVALYYDTKNLLSQDQADKKALTSKMGKEWALAEDSGNDEMMQRVLRQAMVSGIDITRVMNSAKGYSRRFNENGLSNNLDRARVSAIQAMTGVNVPPLE